MTANHLLLLLRKRSTLNKMAVWLPTFTIFFAVFQGYQQQTAESNGTPSRRSASVEHFDWIEITTRYRDRDDQPVFPPHTDSSVGKYNHKEVPEAIRVNFKTDTIVGHADLAQPVRCLLIQADDEKLRYGFYNLWKEKSDLEMPLPFDKSSIAWEGVSARQALIRLLVNRGASKEIATQFVEERGRSFFRHGLRALLIRSAPAPSKTKVQITVYERTNN